MGLREILDNPKGGQTLSLVVGLILAVMVAVVFATGAVHRAMAGEAWLSVIAGDGFVVIIAGQIAVRLVNLLRKRHGAR